MAGDDEQRQPLLGNESQGDYGASTSGGAPPAAEGESREAMEAREIAYACKTGPGGLSSAEAAERLERYGPNVLSAPTASTRRGPSCSTARCHRTTRTRPATATT